MSQHATTQYRQPDAKVLRLAESIGLNPLLSRILANRVNAADLAAQPEAEQFLRRIIKPDLSSLPKPERLADCEIAAERLALAIKNQQRIGVLTDYDVDGITSHAIMLIALRDYLGVPAEQISSYIGHRLEDGYGVSAGLVDKILAAPEQELPEVIITADCGSSDEVNISRLAAAGIDVIVTDHHGIPASGIPKSAYAVVNPTRDDCGYPDATIAGCMVAFLLMCQCRQTAIEMGVVAESVPRLSRLLEFVSLGTVADAVSLQSPVNRAVVQSGLKIINQLQRPCWRAMQRITNAEIAFDTESLGFQLGPRINARGRMADPHAARRFLMAESDLQADAELQTLDDDNQQRKQIEKQMLAVAREQLDALPELPAGLVVTDESFHQGVQGIVASRILERYGRPCCVFSPTKDGLLTGSARSGDIVNIREILQSIHTRHPELLVKFGGHKAAAGMTIPADAIEQFFTEFAAAIQQQYEIAELIPLQKVDADIQDCLNGQALSLQHFHDIQTLAPYGRGWEAPVFSGEFEVQRTRLVGQPAIHLQLQLSLAGQEPVKGIWFNALEADDQSLPIAAGDIVKFNFELGRNSFRGHQSLQLMIKGLNQ